MADNSTSNPPLFRRRGAFPTPRHVLASATPHVAKVGAPPNSITIPKQLSTWGNTQFGDCVTAEEAFAKACHSPEIFISESDVIKWATAHGVLEGAYLNQVLQWMQTDGFKNGREVYDDGPFFTVDWTNQSTLASAIASGPVKIGVAADQLLVVHRPTPGWVGVGFHADAAEDHCVSLCGYGTMSWLSQQLKATVPAGIDGSTYGYAVFTWGSIGILDRASMLAITHEAWLRNPTTVENQSAAKKKQVPVS